MNTLREGSTLRQGSYRIERVLGQGGFGITYLATARSFQKGKLGTLEFEKRVAIKEFFIGEMNSRRPDGSSVEGSTGSFFANYRDKFKREAENLSKLSHPNIVKVFDVFDENNTTYYVMDFIEGENLDEYICRKGKLSETEAISIVREIGKAVDHMHSKRMLHLDIKPKNVMRRSDGQIFLIDFGLSKQLSDADCWEKSTVRLGTPGYAPAEQMGYRKDGSFPATLDVYALGATMLKMLTGKRPPEAMTFINEEIAVEDLIPAGVSDETKSVIRKAMEPRRKKRYQDIKSFIGDLKDVKPQPDDEEDEPTVVGVVANTEAKPAERTQALPKPKPRFNMRWIYVGIGIAVLFVAGFIVWLSLGSKPGSSADKRGDVMVADTTDNASVPLYEYVDLGLPSKVKWATCNVGTSVEWNCGDYFAWGEVKPKPTYTEANCNVFDKSMADISGNSSYDAARAYMGGFWRMPTRAEWQELIDNCQWTWTTIEGKRGYKVVGRNGKSIFLPAAGCRRKVSLLNDGSYGYYWSSTPSADGTPASYYLSFNREGKNIFWNTREFGRSVRPVTN